jgi:outer membrane protein TolC
MSSRIRIVKRKEREANIPRATADSRPEESQTSAIVKTVKNWIATTRERRQADLLNALSFRHAQGDGENLNPSSPFALGNAAAKSNVTGAQESSLALDATETVAFLSVCARAKEYLTVVLVAGLLILGAQGKAQAQVGASAPGDSLTLDQAIDIALRNNHGMKIASLAVGRADEDISAAKTQRLPAFHTYMLVSGNLATNQIKVPNLASDLFPGIGPFFSLNQERRPTAIFAASAIEPLTQQYRIGLHIKLEKLSRDVAQAKFRLQQQETIDKVKKAYYSILQTSSALGSVREAVKSYHELDKVSGDYVIKQVALKADHLVVQTRLAQAEYEELELANRLATQKEQLNSLLGRSVVTEFDVAPVPEFVSVATELTEARKIALERRPELEQARLTVEQATLDRRIKKSEYIPDVSAGFVYLTPRNFASIVPKNFANVGVSVSWEFFDWGRKKHQLAEKDLAIEQAKAGLKETEDQVLIDVGDKLRKLQQSGQALRVARLNEDSATENLRVSTGRYKLQAAMLSDVLQSQASLAEANHEYQQALLAFWTAKAEFEKALGEEK